MRRVFLVWAAMAVVVVGAAGSASAKEDETHAKVTIIGEDLPNGIVTLGEDGAAFAIGSGLWAVKWDAPNIGGTLEPDAHLGPVYEVRVVLDCGPGRRSRYRQTLYPDAPQGPQLFTPEGVEACGTDAPSGFDALGPGLEELLARHGLAFHPIADARQPTANPASSGGMPALAAVGLPFVGAALVAGEVIRRRRRRR